ncbi:hypothetical protein AB4250_10020 [Vibrio cyclitrophicus]
MRIGKTWAVFECDAFDDSRKLLSLMPPRMAPQYVHFFVEQTFVDRYGDLTEKLDHKKQTSSNLRAKTIGSVVCLKLSGENKYIVAYKCVHSEILGDIFRFTYNKITHLDDGTHRIKESEYLEAKVS